jgi:ADP-heptose:LPS heptosyltransferase
MSGLLKIVIPIVAGVGNALMAVPMVRQLKRALPTARISVVARLDAMAEPFRRLMAAGEVDAVLVSGGGMRGHLRAIGMTRRIGADVYLVPFPSNRWQYSLLAQLSGSGRRILHGYPIGYWQALHFLPAERVPAQPGIHDVVQNLRLLGALGIEPDESEAPVFLLDDADRDHADAMLREIGVERGMEFIAVHAGSARTILAQAKRWPTESYASLVTQLNAATVLLEGPDETGVAHEILQRGHAASAKVLRLRGALGDAAGVLERASMYVGSDSGLAHLAAAVGTPPVTIFAPADPDRVCPFGYRHLVIQPPTACTPCFRYPWQVPYPSMSCREPMCVTQVSVARVLEKMRNAKAKIEH